jgi:hypothetical protein
MSQPESPKQFSFDRPGTYRIRVQGSLDESWTHSLGGMTISRWRLCRSPLRQVEDFVSDSGQERPGRLGCALRRPSLPAHCGSSSRSV